MRLRHAVGALLVVIAFGAVPGVATAQSGPSLTGETLAQPGILLQTEPSGCTTNRNGRTTYTFSTSGFASGPYNGTFRENVRVTVGPQVIPVPNPFGFPLFAGPIVRFDAEFRIESQVPPGTVTGTKRVIANVPAGTGTCREFDNELFTVPGGPTLVLNGVEKQANAVVGYEATIRTATGAFRDRGTSEVQFIDAFINDPQGLPIRRVHQFLETFQSTGVTPLPGDEDDGDDEDDEDDEDEDDDEDDDDDDEDDDDEDDDD
jgi:hypothetical protein